MATRRLRKASKKQTIKGYHYNDTPCLFYGDIMNIYTQMADDFLSKANAKIDITFIGRAVNSDWGETALRNLYDVKITTRRGSMTIKFWDSLYNTQITQMSIDDYAKKCFRTHYNCLTSYERTKASKELKEKQNGAKPTAYDVLACLTKYDCGSFDNFCLEYGYNNDSIRALKTYLACSKEYEELHRIFNAEQMEELREIN